MGVGGRREQEGHHAHSCSWVQSTCVPRSSTRACVAGSFSRKSSPPSVLTTPAHCSEEPRRVKGASSTSAKYQPGPTGHHGGQNLRAGDGQMRLPVSHPLQLHIQLSPLSEHCSPVLHRTPFLLLQGRSRARNLTAGHTWYMTQPSRAHPGLSVGRSKKVHLTT